MSIPIDKIEQLAKELCAVDRSNDSWTTPTSRTVFGQDIKTGVGETVREKYRDRARADLSETATDKGSLSI